MTKAKKRGRPRKAEGDAVDHRLTPKMKIAITAIVEDNLPRAEAAKLAGLTDEAVRKGMRENPAVVAFYKTELKNLRTFAVAKAFHTLIKECDGPNASARVAAARTLIEENATTANGSGMGNQPGFTIRLVDNRMRPAVIDVTPLPGAALLPVHRD